MSVVSIGSKEKKKFVSNSEKNVVILCAARRAKRAPTHVMQFYCILLLSAVGPQRFNSRKS